MFFCGLLLFVTSKRQFPSWTIHRKSISSHLLLHDCTSLYILLSTSRFHLMEIKEDKSTLSFPFHPILLQRPLKRSLQNRNPSILQCIRRSKQRGFKIQANILQLLLDDPFSNQRIFKSLQPTHLSIQRPICSFFFLPPLPLRGPGGRRRSSWRSRLHWPWLGKRRRRRARRRPSARTVLPGRRSGGRTRRLEPSTLFPPPSGAAHKGKKDT